MTTDHEQLFPYRDHNSIGTIRAWRPGDGLTCSFASRGSSAQPCGRPVAVRETSWLGRGEQRKRLVVCMYHVGGALLSLGDLRAEAEKQAREKIIVEHWDEYQTIIRQRVRERIAEELVDLPEDLRTLIANGLRAQDEAAENP